MALTDGDHPIRVIGQRIRELRESRGFTQEDVAHRVGVSFSTVNRWENGRLDIKAGNLLRLAAALGVEVKAIFEPPQERGGGLRGRDSDPQPSGWQQLPPPSFSEVPRMPTRKLTRAAA